jgi:hypothetical protein
VYDGDVGVDAVMPLYGFPAPIAGQGVINEAAGILGGAGSVTGVGKCIGIRVYAQGADGSFNINGGPTIEVRQNAGVDINPEGNLVAPVVNWVSGTIDVLIVGV